MYVFVRVRVRVYVCVRACVYVCVCTYPRYYASFVFSSRFTNIHLTSLLQDGRVGRFERFFGLPPPRQSDCATLLSSASVLTLRTLAVLSAFSYSAIAASKLGATAGAAHQVIPRHCIIIPPIVLLYVFFYYSPCAPSPCSRPSPILPSLPAS